MKYYKITNKEENHNGLQYHDGINEDICPFNPSGDCIPGGIYFASRDILAFINYGYWIREVMPLSEIYENPGSPKKYKAHKVKLDPRRKIDLNIIKELIEEGADIHENVFYFACKNNDLKLLKFLIKNETNIYTNNDNLLSVASEFGNLKIVKFLIENGADIHARESLALCWAADNGNLEIVKYLVEKEADIHIWNNMPLNLAIQNGHTKVVEYLNETL
jgi:hypothetical protein